MTSNHAPATHFTKNKDMILKNTSLALKYPATTSEATSSDPELQKNFLNREVQASSNHTTAS